MKKILALTLALGFISLTFAQNDRYKSAMSKNIGMLDSMMQKNNAAEITNNFIRIGDAEKDQWLPYYYAAYATAMQAILEPDNTKKDAIADKASELITKAATLAGKENSEIEVIKSLISTARLTVDPQSRYMTYGTEISQALQKSKALDSTNPRPALIEAQNVFYTPESFGGGKEAAKPLFEKAAKLFETFKPETELSPVWGKAILEYFLSQYK